MPPKQRKSIIATRGQKCKQAENPTPNSPEGHNSAQTNSLQNAQSDSTDELGKLKRQVRQLMESQGQIMGMIQGAFLNHQGAANPIEESDALQIWSIKNPNP